jgi:hypothetical protein
MRDPHVVRTEDGSVGGMESEWTHGAEKFRATGRSES